MKKKQLDHFRLLLISSKEEIEQIRKTNTEAAGTVTLDQSMMGRLSRMDALQDQQMAQETTRRRKIQLQKIDSALRRMDAGTYGCCLRCGDEIERARLDFDSASTRCIGCMDN